MNKLEQTYTKANVVFSAYISSFHQFTEQMFLDFSESWILIVLFLRQLGEIALV